MNEHRQPSHRPATAGPGRAAVALGISGALLGAVLTFAAVPAGAAIGPFQVSPASGPPGTAVTVSGGGCSPGLVRTPTQDYVSVSSTTLPLGMQVPVSASGAWSTTFTVPAGTLAAPAALTALCFTDGLPSLTTLYTPGTFLVTTAPAPTPTTSPPPSSAGPPTTKATATTEAGSGTPGNRAGASSGTTSGGAGTSAGGGGGSGDPDLIGTSAPGSAAGDEVGGVAGLRSPELTSDASSASGGIGWGWWLLLALLVSGAVGTWWWLRHRHATGTDLDGLEQVAGGELADREIEGPPVATFDDADAPDFPVGTP
jgi:hypothetical protein